MPQTAAEIARTYGFSAAFFHSSPELSSLIAQAVKGQWTAEKFSAAMMNTSFYKTHNASQRQWLQLTTSDPAEATKQRRQRLQMIEELAKSLGIPPGQFNAQAMVEQSLSQGMDQNEIQLGITSHNQWYKTHSKTQRDTEALKLTDPVEYNRIRKQRVDSISQQALGMGVKMDWKTRLAIADQSMKEGFDNDAIRHAISGHANLQGAQAGELGSVATKLDEMQADYGLPPHSLDSSHYAARILQGKITEDDFLKWTKYHAKTMYPGMAAAIDAGQSVKEYAAPYMAQMAQTLELNPANARNLNDPTIQKALQHRGDGKGGKGNVPEPMPLWQFNDSLKEDPRWMQTDNARKSLLDGGTQLLKSFGLVT